MSEQPSKKHADNHLVSEALRAFEGQALVYASRFIPDARIRREYIAKAQEVSRSTRELYDGGKITALQAEEIAHTMRGEIMEFARVRTSEMGKTVAVILKEKNIPLEALVIKYSSEKFRKLPGQLSAAERDIVALEVVAASGRTSTGVNTLMRNLGRAGRGLWVLTALVAAYNVGSAQNKAVAAGREGATMAGGVGGGTAGGALVGAAVTGPLAPIGAAIGAVLGGILGAALADEIYVENVVPMSEVIVAIVPRFTHVLWRDEEAMATALYEECGINIDDVCAVVAHLNEYYNTDADDIVLCYAELVRKYGGSVEQALRQHPTARQLLIHTLESGWTGTAEQDAIGYLRRL